MTLAGARLYLFGEDKKLIAEQVIFFVAPQSPICHR
jgi:hypothetical protein